MNLPFVLLGQLVESFIVDLLRQLFSLVQNMLQLFLDTVLFGLELDPELPLHLEVLPEALDVSLHFSELLLEALVLAGQFVSSVPQLAQVGQLNFGIGNGLMELLILPPDPVVEVLHGGRQQLDSALQRFVLFEQLLGLLPQLFVEQASVVVMGFVLLERELHRAALVRGLLGRDEVDGLGARPRELPRVQGAAPEIHPSRYSFILVRQWASPARLPGQRLLLDEYLLAAIPPLLQDGRSVRPVRGCGSLCDRR